MRNEYETKIFSTCPINVRHLKDPPIALRAKPFDAHQVDSMAKDWIPERCLPAHAVLWDLPDDHYSSQFGLNFQFGLTKDQARRAQNMSKAEFERICNEDKEEDWRGLKLFVTSGRHTSRALEERVRLGKLYPFTLPSCEKLSGSE